MALEMCFLKTCLVYFVVLVISTSAINLQFQMSGDNGEISSPNYPNKYPVNMTCRWTISTIAGTRILINFTDFKVEKNKKCLYDYLVIKESRNGWGTLSSKYCGHGSIKTYTSQANHVQIYFVSDKLGNVDKGFVATWRITDMSGNPLASKDKPRIFPSSIVKPCPTVTITKASMPCTKIKLLPTKIIDGVKSTKCYCETAVPKTIYKTVTKYEGKPANGIKPTATYDGIAPLTSTAENSIPGNGSGCENGVSYDKHSGSASTRNRNIVIAFGCLLFVLIVANIILVAVICRRDSSGYSLYNMKTCLPRKTAKPRSVEHFYSSGPRPTLRMVDGDIVVVSTNGKVLRHQAPGDQTTLETSDNSNHQNQTQVSQQTESLSLTRTRTMTSERVPPEIPFHLIPPPEIQSMTLSSAGTSALHESAGASSCSEAESEFY